MAISLFLPSSKTILRTVPIEALVRDVFASQLLATKPTLAELLAAAPTPWTLSGLAVHLGVAPALLERVVAGRQPLPRRLAAQMAAAAGLQPSDIEAVVPSVISQETPIAYYPAPADPCFGETLDFVPLARTIETYV